MDVTAFADAGDVPTRFLPCWGATEATGATAATGTVSLAQALAVSPLRGKNEDRPTSACIGESDAVSALQSIGSDGPFGCTRGAPLSGLRSDALSAAIEEEAGTEFLGTGMWAVIEGIAFQRRKTLSAYL